MKIKLLTIVLLISLAFVQSCSKSSPSPSPSVVGTWKLTTEEYFNCPTSTDNKVYTCGNYGYCVTYTFNSDKTFHAIRTWDNYDLGSGTYVFTGGAISLSYSGSVTPTVLQVTVSGSSMVCITPKSSSCSFKDTYQKQ